MSSFSSPALCGAPIVTAFMVGNHWGGNAGSWLSSFGIELRNCISYILKSWVVWKMHFMYCLGILHCILRLPYADLSSSKPETEIWKHFHCVSVNFLPEMIVREAWTQQLAVPLKQITISNHLKPALKTIIYLPKAPLMDNFPSLTSTDYSYKSRKTVMKKAYAVST